MPGKLGGKFWNEVHDEVVRQAADLYMRAVKELMVDGYPPGSEPVPDQQEYLRLVEMKLKADPNFAGSVQAQQRLAELEMRFGPAPMLPPSFAPAPAPPGVY